MTPAMDWQDAATLIALGAALLPGLVGFAISRGMGWNARQARRATAASGGLAFLLAGIAAGAFLVGGSAGTSLQIPAPTGLSAIGPILLVDGLTSLMLVTIGLIGAVVTRFAVRYLDGDPEQARFSQWLAYTLSAVLLLVISGQLLLFFVAWVGASHGLHRLLTHRADRPAALAAARSKFVVSRIADLCLAAAFLLLFLETGSLALREILAADGVGSQIDGIGWIALLLVLAAMAKSAQVPFHAWLPDSMETPTPVSALMHAGLVNAGGFLLIRMSPILVEAPVALVVLTAAGCLTAVLGATAMLAQTDIKRKLAYSTIAQMGFMLLQCGLGAFGAAALHLVGHSFYKGYSFLSTGSQIDPIAPATRGRSVSVPAPIQLAAGLPIAVGLVLVASWLVGIDLPAKSGFGVLGLILVLGLVQIVQVSREAAEPKERGLLAGTWRLETLAIGLAVALTYLLSVGLVERLLGSALPSGLGLFGPGGWPLAAIVLGFFLASLGVQEWAAKRSDGDAVVRFYLAAQNGFYLGLLLNRLIARLWPLPSAPSRRNTVHGGGDASWA